MKYELSRQSWGADVTETWTLRVEQGSVLLSGPQGGQVVLPGGEDPRSMLEAIQLQAPDALEVRSAHTTRITVSGGFRAWLPLFLRATDPSSSPGQPEDWSEIDDYADRLTNLGIGAGTDLMVHVGGQPWAAVDGADRRLVIPIGGRQDGGLLTTWASWSWIESGSMTSGSDFAWIGTLTRTVGASHDRLDEVGSQYRVFALDNPTGAIVEWLTSGWLIGELRSTWTIESGDDPLIQGFIEMLAEDSDRIRFSRDDYVQGDGVGLTDTAQ